MADYRFQIFGFDGDYPTGGLFDLRGRASTLEDAKRFAKGLGVDFVQILDVNSLEVHELDSSHATNHDPEIEWKVTKLNDWGAVALVGEWGELVAVHHRTTERRW